MSELNFNIIETVGALSKSKKGWVKELNLISWNGTSPKYDLRNWSPDHEVMGKGITISKDELKELYKLLKNIFPEEK